MIKEVFRSINGVISQDLGNRGLCSIVGNDDLESAVRELNISTRVLIVTGFCIKSAMVGETDGPIGAVSVASALKLLGKDVLIMTDKYSRGLVDACCKAKNINIDVKEVSFENTDEFCKKTIIEFKPSHIISIERPGRALDNRCYSMKGEDLSDIVPNTDTLFSIASDVGIRTLAIGDGGNEMGMGKISPLIKGSVENGEKICAKTSCDYLIVAGVSNWGAHGLVAGLSVTNLSVLLHDYIIEEKMLKAMVEAGAVDGCSKKQELTVDGLSLEVNLDIVTQLNNIADSYIKRTSVDVAHEYAGVGK